MVLFVSGLCLAHRVVNRFSASVWFIEFHVPGKPFINVGFGVGSIALDLIISWNFTTAQGYGSIAYLPPPFRCRVLGPFSANFFVPFSKTGLRWTLAAQRFCFSQGSACREMEIKEEIQVTIEANPFFFSKAHQFRCLRRRPKK